MMLIKEKFVTLQHQRLGHPERANYFSECGRMLAEGTGNHKSVFRIGM